MDGKKISFGFSKINKRSNILPSKAPTEEKKVELIKCLEGQEIKLLVEKEKETPLIIPLKQNQKTSSALASLIKRRAVLLDETESTKVEELATDAPKENGVSTEAQNLEQRATQELLAQAQAVNEDKTESTLALPVIKADELPLDGAKESTMEDYESIPIQQFGLAMLRGMGWVAPPPKKGALPVDEGPQVRPKGMGLGADKALKSKPLLVPPEKNEVLEIKKQAFVRILGGKYKDLYGQIQGFDDHAGRVIVKMAIGGKKEAFNEFLCQPVARKEYAEYGKCINTAKFEEYKKMENEHGQIIVKKEIKVEKQTKKEYKDSVKQDEDRKKHKYDIKHESNDKKWHENAQKTEIKRTENQHNFENNRFTETKNRGRDYDDYKHTDAHSDRRNKYEDTRRLNEHKERRKSRSKERSRPHKSQTSGSSYNSHTAASRDSSISSQTDSDTDSAYDRKHKTKQKKTKKSKSKKTKQSKHRHEGSDEETEDSSITTSSEEAKRHKSHKKKTKKSKKHRSRTRSRSRNRR